MLYYSFCDFQIKIFYTIDNIKYKIYIEIYKNYYRRYTYNQNSFNKHNFFVHNNFDLKSLINNEKNIIKIKTHKKLFELKKSERNNKIVKFEIDFEYCFINKNYN